MAVAMEVLVTAAGAPPPPPPPPPPPGVFVFLEPPATHPIATAHRAAITLVLLMSLPPTQVLEHASYTRPGAGCSEESYFGGGAGSTERWPLESTRRRYLVPSGAAKTAV